MKKAIAVYLILLLLLCGCGRRQDAPEDADAETPPRLFIAGQLNADAYRMIFRLSFKQQGTLGGADADARTVFEIDTKHRLVRINKNPALDDLRVNDLRSCASYPCAGYICCLRTSDDQPILLSRLDPASGERLNIAFPKMCSLASGRVASDETGRLYFLAYRSTRLAEQRTAELFVVDLKTGSYHTALSLEAGRSNYRLLGVSGSSLLVEERRLPDRLAGSYMEHLSAFGDVEPQILEIPMPDAEPVPYTGKWLAFGLDETNYTDPYTNDLYYTGVYLDDDSDTVYFLNPTTRAEGRIEPEPLLLTQSGGPQRFRQALSPIPVGASPEILLLRVGFVDWAEHCESFPIYACITRENYQAGSLTLLELLDYSAVFPGFRLSLHVPDPETETLSVQPPLS